jgi:hypothetical protein
VAVVLVSAAIGGAGALLWLRLHFQPPTVPHYVLAGAPSAPADPTSLKHDATFSMDLRPAGVVDGAVAARAFLLRGDVVRPWSVPFVVERDGTVRIAGPVDALFAGVPRGDWEVAIAVGRPENLPVDPRDVLRARDRTADGGAAAWHLVRERIYLEE